MALINCKECGKEISSKSKTCPNCGCPIKKKSFFKLISTIVVTVVIVFILLIILGFLVSSTENEQNYSNVNSISTSQESSSSEYDEYKEVIEEIKNLKLSLYSPNSFQLNRVSLFTAESGTYFSNYLNVIVDYSGNNKFGGTVRKYRIYKYVYNDENNLELYVDNYNNYYKEYDFDKYSYSDVSRSATYNINNIQMTNVITRDLDLQEVLYYINN